MQKPLTKKFTSLLHIKNDTPVKSRPTTNKVVVKRVLTLRVG